MSQKSEHTRYEKIILGRISCEEAPQVVPAWLNLFSTFSGRGSVLPTDGQQWPLPSFHWNPQQAQEVRIFIFKVTVIIFILVIIIILILVIILMFMLVTIRKGVAKKLMQRVLEEAKERDVHNIISYVRNDNKVNGPQKSSLMTTM